MAYVLAFFCDESYTSALAPEAHYVPPSALTAPPRRE